MDHSVYYNILIQNKLIKNVINIMYIILPFIGKKL